MKDKCEHCWEIDFMCVLASNPPKYSARCVRCQEIKIIDDLIEFMSNNKVYNWPV